MTARAPIERETQLPSERRLNSSTTLRRRIGPERRVVALTKSYDQVWFTAQGRAVARRVLAAALRPLSGGLLPSGACPDRGASRSRGAWR